MKNMANKIINVLIVDDEQIVREGLRYIIDWNTLGFCICGEAANGEDALEMIRQYRPGFYGMLMRNCYTFPLSSNRDTMKKFLSSMDTVLQHGDFMLVYPEQSMWWNYRKPKPLKKGAYTFGAKNHVPVLPCFITMEDSDILGDDGFYVQEYTIHIAEPIYPDPQKTQAENVDAMRRKNAAVWKQIYEEFYGIPLVYDTAEAVQYVGKPTNIA